MCRSVIIFFPSRVKFTFSSVLFKYLRFLNSFSPKFLESQILVVVNSKSYYFNIQVMSVLWIPCNQLSSNMQSNCLLDWKDAGKKSCRQAWKRLLAPGELNIHRNSEWSERGMPNSAHLFCIPPSKFVRFMCT